MERDLVSFQTTENISIVSIAEATTVTAVITVNIPFATTKCDYNC